jgi:protein phosphatase
MGLLGRLIGREEDSASAQASSPDGATLSVPSRFNVGWVSDVGQMRDHNEDAALVITAAHDGDDGPPSFGLFVLADGMGGHRAGEVASSLASRVAAHHIADRSYLPSLLSRERDADQPALTEVLVEAVKAANSAVSKEVPGSGTTLICALVLGTQAYIAHVGDSRAYILTEAGLEQITHDHSLVDRLINAGRLAPEEAAEHPQKNVLYRAIGQSSVLEVDTHVRKVRPGDYLLLCSDGLWGAVGEGDIVDRIRGASSLQMACEELVAAANRAGGDDNITAILWRSPLG